MVRHSADPGVGVVPARAGIALKGQHVSDVLVRRPDVGFFEVHTENYLSAGGHAMEALAEIARTTPISLHGVGLSPGSADGLDPIHLERVAGAIDRFRPALVSEHVAWATAVAEGRPVYHNDLLPVPYTHEAIAVLADNVNRFQDRLGRRVLMENPSTYLRFTDDLIAEGAFMACLVRRTGCGLLLDVNNIHVSCHNHGWDPIAWLDCIDGASVGEIHLAGHAWRPVEGLPHGLCIDDHGSAVPPVVWDLYRAAIARFGPKPTLIEWDSNVPELDVLLAEAATADAILLDAGGVSAEVDHAAE